MIRLIKPLVIITMLILTTNNVFAKKKPMERFYRCLYKDEKDCSDATAVEVSCGYAWVAVGGDPCNVQEYYVEDQILKKAGCCSQKANVIQTPVKYSFPSIGEIYPSDDFNLVLECSSGDIYTDVYDWGALVPDHWEAFGTDFSTTATDLVITVTKLDSLTIEDSTINITVPLSHFESICNTQNPFTHNLKVFGEDKIVHLKDMEFKVLKNISDDMLILEFNNLEIQEETSLKINIYSIDGKLIKTIIYEEDKETISTKYSELPKGVIIITASTNSNSHTIKYLVE